MNVSTADPAAIQLTRRQLVGLIVSVTALAASVTWALTAAAIATRPGQTRTTIPTSQGVPAGNPTATTAAGQLVDYDAQPIIVADAYHGVGFMVLRRDTQPVTVADSYHGIGIAVCV